MTRLPPEDRVLLALFIVAILVLVILIHDLRRAEPAEYPQYRGNAQMDTCTLRLLRDLAATTGLPVNGVDGHGATYDLAWRLCEDDPWMVEWPEKVTMDGVLSGGGGE